MRNINRDTGCVFDTLVFLSEYFEEIFAGQTGRKENANQYYLNIKQGLNQKGIAIPHYLVPFFHRRKKNAFFLYGVIFDRPYGDCSYVRLKRVIQNRSFMKRGFAEYYFSHTDSATVQKLIDADHPGVIDLLRQQPAAPELESYLLYAILKFEPVLQELNVVIEAVYQEIAEAQQSFLSQTENFTAALQKDSVLNKLKAISKPAGAGGPPFTFSLSLMDGDLISFHPDEPSFFLLGYDFELVLERKYKYCDVTPYSFAQAIGNPARYDIYRVLLGNPPMTAAEIGKKLHLSRNALAYNLKEMQDSGLLAVDHVKGLTFYYRIDHEYIRVVSEQLRLDADPPGNTGNKLR